MRKTKTDKIDAEHIAKLYKIGESHPTVFPQDTIMNLRELTRAYTFLVDLRTRVLNRIGVVLFQVHPEFKEAFSNPFGNTPLTPMQKMLVHPFDLRDEDPDFLRDVLKKSSRSRFGREKALELIGSAQAIF